MLSQSIYTKINNEVGRCTSFTFVFWLQSSHEDFVSEKLYWEKYLRTFLTSLRVPCAISPCHDQDIDSIDCETGEINYKKTHWHVAVDFGSGNNKTIKQIFDMLEPIINYISIAPWDRYFDELERSFITDVDLYNVLQAFDVYEPEYVFNFDDDGFTKIKKVWLTQNVIRNMRSLLRYFKHLDNPEKFQYTEPITSIGGFEVEDRIYSQTDSYYLLDQIFDYIEENHIYSYWRLLKYCRKNNREWYSVMCRNQFSNMVINAMKSFAFDDTGALDKAIDKYENK